MGRLNKINRKASVPAKIDENVENGNVKRGNFATPIHDALGYTKTIEHEHKTPAVKKPISRLERMKLKTDKKEQDKKDLSFIKRSVGQQNRYSRLNPIKPEVTPEDKPKTDTIISERSTSASRLQRLGVKSSADQDTTATIQRVQMTVNDDHLKTSSDKIDRRAELMAEIDKANENSEANSPFKMVDYELLDDSQKHAVNSVGKYKYAIINGPAGTGKTTVTQHVVEATKADVTHRRASILRRNYDWCNTDIPSIAFVAFTGKAVQNMREKLPMEFREHNCMTIHKLLGYAPEYEEYYDKQGNLKQKRIFTATYDQVNQLLWEKIYIDEAGMAPAKLINEIIVAAPNAQIVFIGDSAQLPAIHGLAPFNAYLTTLPTFTLDKVHRTDDQDLVMHATAIRNGERVKFNSKNCFQKLISPNSTKAQGQIVSAIVNLYKSGEFDPKLDTIISPTNNHEIGQLELNRLLRRHFNPDNQPILINAIAQTCRYAVGDKVMILSNDDEQGLTNGMTGYIVDIEKNGRCTRVDSSDVKSPDMIDLTHVQADHDDDPGKRQASHICYVYFPTAYADNKIIAISTQGGYSALSHGYVSTCHKAQGSEYRNVIIVMHPTGKRLINREWFYTAWTRAQEKVYVLSDLNSLACARNKQSLKGENVRDKARIFMEKHKERIDENTGHFSATGLPLTWECPVFLYEEETA